jgi:hypothetical protein
MCGLSNAEPRGEAYIETNLKENMWSQDGRQTPPARSPLENKGVSKWLRKAKEPPPL